MEEQAKQLTDELLRLIEHLKREVEESRRYLEKSAPQEAMRNQNENRDEFQNLVRKWEELHRLLEQH